MTQDDLKDILRYELKTGFFYWKSGPRAGKRAGSIGSHGYRQIKIGPKFYTEHRLAWFYVHGRWPSDCVDHVDRNKLNNSIDNLREATAQQNRRNRLYRGYERTPCGNFAARIKVDSSGKSYVFLGTFNTEAEAAAAYVAANVKHFGQFSPFVEGEV